MTPQPAKILAVMSDLFFSVKIMEAAKRLGLGARFVKDRQVALEQIQALPPMVIFDLNCDSVNAMELLRTMKADPATARVPTIGFVSHVQTDLRQAAKAGGCDIVVPRSVFATSVDELLARYAPGATSSRS